MTTLIELDHADHELEDHDRGLIFDLYTLDRRRVLKLLGFGGMSATLFTIAGCGPSGASGSATAGAASATAGTDASCAIIPEETAGPYPGDGSNGPNVLSERGVVRSDIRSSFGSSTTVAEGIQLTIQLTIQDGADCVPLAGAAVYLWHCDRDGEYSLYSDSIANENYLRGVQAADDNGLVTFTSIFPAVTQGAGRMSISRSTPAWTSRPMRRTRSRHRRSRCPRMPATPSTRRTATAGASTRSPRSASRPTTSLARTAAPSSWERSAAASPTATRWP